MSVRADHVRPHGQGAPSGRERESVREIGGGGERERERKRERERADARDLVYVVVQPLHLIYSHFLIQTRR